MYYFFYKPLPSLGYNCFFLLQGEYAASLPLFRRALAVLDEHSNDVFMHSRGSANDAAFRDPSATTSHSNFGLVPSTSAEHGSVLRGFASALFQTVRNLPFCLCSCANRLFFVKSPQNRNNTSAPLLQTMQKLAILIISICLII